MTFGRCPTRVNPWAVGPSQQAVPNCPRPSRRTPHLESPLAFDLSLLRPAALVSRSLLLSRRLQSPPITNPREAGWQAPAADKRNARRCNRAAIAQREAATSGRRRPGGTARPPPSVRTLQRASGSRAGGQHPASRPPGAELERHAHTSARRCVGAVVGNTQSPKS